MCVCVRILYFYFLMLFIAFYHFPILHFIRHSFRAFSVHFSEHHVRNSLVILWKLLSSKRYIETERLKSIY